MLLQVTETLLNLNFIFHSLKYGMLTTKPCIFTEYGEGSAVSTYGDIYSLGILLLEMFTGRSPTEGTFGDSLGLHKFAEDALPDRSLEIDS